MGLSEMLSNNVETKELHDHKELRTRYYKSSFRKIKEQLEVFCNDSEIEVKNIDEVHGEMFLQTNKYHMIISMIQVTPIETAVDIKVQTYKVIGMYAPKKLILSMYKYLDSKFTFKGTSLHP